MSLNRQEKAAVVEEVGALVASSQSIVVAEYRGLDVDAITKLRKQARGQGVQLRVLKNTLARRAVGGTPFSGLSDKLVGPLVYGFSNDPVAAAKVLSSFAKENDKLIVKAGGMPNFVMDEKGVKQLAMLPSRDELLAKLMATMQAPIGQFVRTLNEVPSRLVRTLAALRDASLSAMHRLRNPRQHLTDTTKRHNALLRSFKWHFRIRKFWTPSAPSLFSRSAS